MTSKYTQGFLLRCMTLTTAAHGRFSDNAFEMIGGSKLVQVIPFGELDRAGLTKTLRVEDLAQHQ